MMMVDGNRSPGLRVMFYCHDTFGLGHLRRTLTLAHHLRQEAPEVSQLIVTGSPVANGFRFPEGTDFIKLPSVTKNSRGEYEPYLRESGLAAIRTMRSDILLSAAAHFAPDFLIVDHAPAGMKGEAVATLRYLKQAMPQTRLVVGLRDIMDEAPKVRQSWAAEGVYELLDELYDLILVYGNRRFYDLVSEYGLSPKAARKTRFVGYLGREPGRRSPDEVRASLQMQTDRLVVVTAGGGGDGKALYDATQRALAESRDLDFDCVIVGGPLLSDVERTDVRAQLANRGNVHFLDFTDDLASYLGAADAVISMGGYNSVCEILSLARPAIIVPRTTPRKEQLIRASILSEQGLLQMIHPDELTPQRLITATRQLLENPPAPRPAFPMDGLRNVVQALRGLRESMPAPLSLVSA